MNFTFNMNIHGKTMPVKITKKKMKKVRLKVFPSNEIRLSVPYNTPDDWIKEFLNKKKDWMTQKINDFERTKSIEKEEHIFSGSATRILGRQLIITVELSSKKSIIQNDTNLIVYTPHPNNQLEVDKQYNKWWQQSARNFFLQMIDEKYSIIQKHGIPKPNLMVKKMKTLWGSCSKKAGRVNLNFYLYKASLPCIEYVILHELIHFLYPYHNKDFYDLLTIYMPDWQTRKKKLDYDYVIGV